MTFHFKKCRVRVNFYFFAVVCLLAFFDRNGTLLIGLLSAFFHESGHLAAMLLLPGQAPEEVSLTPFGMRIRHNPLAEFACGSVAVLAAGSLVNLALALAAAHVFAPFASVNLLLGLINLLPVDTLDGGGILRLVLGRLLPRRVCEIAVTAVSVAVLTAMALTGVWILCRTRYNFTLLGMSLWLLITLMLRLVSSGHDTAYAKHGLSM